MNYSGATASIVMPHDAVLMSSTTGKPLHLRGGNVEVIYEKDLAGWVRSKAIRGLTFANRSEEEHFLSAYQDITPNDYT